MKIRESFTEISSEGITERIKSFIGENIEAERSSDTFERADKRWVGFDRLINAIRKKVQIDDLISAAKQLVKDNEGYLVNAGLSILALPDIAQRLQDSEAKAEVVGIFLQHIPGQNIASKLGDRSAAMYNFIRSVEGLLNLDPMGPWKQKLTDTHIKILQECCESPDMYGTRIYEEYRSKN